MINLDKIMTKKDENGATVPAAPKGQITSVFYLDAKPTMEQALRSLKAFSEKHPRFSAFTHVSTCCDNSFFEDKRVRGDMKWDYHVQEETVTDRDALEARVQELMNAELDEKRPLWQATVLSVEGMAAQTPRGKSSAAAANAAPSSPSSGGSWFGMFGTSSPASAPKDGGAAAGDGDGNDASAAKPKFVAAGGDAAFVFRFNHCLGDGLRMVQAGG